MSGLTAQFSPAQPAAPLSDASFSSNKMVLSTGYAAVAAAYNTDMSNNSYVITPGSTTKPITYSPFQHGYLGQQFNGSSWATGPSGSQAAVDSYGASGSYTLECWLNISTYANAQGLIATTGIGSTGYWRAWGISNLATELYIGNKASTNTYLVTLSSAMPTGEWFHFAIVGTNGGTNVTVYVNGVSVATVTDNTTFAAGPVSNTQVGIFTGSGQRPLAASTRISNLRFTSATDSSGARYTANFTPSIAPLVADSKTTLLMFQNFSGLVDNSTNAYAFTVTGTAPVAVQGPLPMPLSSGSVAMSVSTDAMTMPTAAPLQFGTGDFTVECWYYPTEATTNREYVIVGNVSANNNNSWYFSIYNSVVRLSAWNSGWVSSTSTIAINRWYHLAISRSGNTFRVFLNGVLDNSNTIAVDLNSTAAFNFSSNTLANSHVVGYVSNLRLSKGIARYIASFTPSTVPLTNDQYTSLLTFQTAGVPSNSQFFDSSPVANIMAVTGTPVQSGFSPYTSAAWGGEFNGSTDYLEFASNAAFGYGTGDYTVEGWFNSRADWATMSATLVSGDSTGGLAIYVAAGTLRIAPQNSSSTSLGSVTSLAMNTWYHIAVTRKSGSTRAYVNGLPLAAAVTDNTSYGTTLYRVGGGTDGRFNGWISNVRAVKGTAIYDPAVASFTAPTSPLAVVANTSLLTLTASTFNDRSANNFTATAVGTPAVTTKTPFNLSVAGSTYFDGSSAIAGTASGALGTGDFTVECWLYPTVAGLMYPVSNILNSGGGDAQWNFNLNSSSQPRFSGWFTDFVTGSTAVTTNAWNHLAAVRRLGTLTLYLNGVSVGSVSNSTNFSSTNPIYIGRSAAPSGPVTGYISDTRVVAGEALYTAAFTPPNAPLQPTAKTKMLLSASTTTSIVDITKTSTVQLFGSALLSSATKKYASAVLSFSGSKYARFTTPSSMALGSGNFTLEFWFNPTTNGSYLIDFSINSTNGTAPQIYFNGSGYSWWVNTGDRIVSSVPATGVWHHLAVCRSSGTTRMFLNGVQTGSNYTDGTNYTVNTYGYLGRPAAGGGSFNGFIEGVRITPGVARYTGTFTPPATVFPQQ